MTIGGRAAGEQGEQAQSFLFQIFITLFPMWGGAILPPPPHSDIINTMLLTFNII